MRFFVDSILSLGTSFDKLRMSGGKGLRMAGEENEIATSSFPFGKDSSR